LDFNIVSQRLGIALFQLSHFRLLIS
jgi:hypothetical protein